MKNQPPETLETSFYYVLNELATSTVASEQQKLIKCLASVDNVKLIDELIKLAVYGTQPKDYTGNEAKIRDQDLTFTLTSISSRSQTGNNMVWSWLRVHWYELVDKFSLNDRTLGRFAPSVVEGFDSEEKLWEVRDFFEATEGGAGEGYRANALATIESNIFWVENNLEDVLGWIKSRE